jgi:hypothetical protein
MYLSLFLIPLVMSLKMEICNYTFPYAIKGKLGKGITLAPTFSPTFAPVSPTFAPISYHSDSLINSEFLGPNLIPFGPGCYNGDNSTHYFDVTVMTDYAFVQTHGANALTDIMNVLNPISLLYYKQANIYPKFKVIFGKLGDPNPMGRDKDNCAQALLAFNEMGKWTFNTTLTSDMFLFLTDCFHDITGVSYIGSVCGKTSNFAVAHADSKTASHELGHAFGCSHSFENGVGTTGGVMDYGDSLYNNTFQFHPNKRVEMCGTLSYAASIGCLKPYTHTCGDGILDSTEQCECLNNVKSCSNCNNCKINKKQKKQCSISSYIPQKHEIAITDYLSSKECCNNKYGLCKSGMCVDSCYGYKICNTYPCSIDCSVSDRCVNVKYPDGTICGTNKKCENNICV